MLNDTANVMTELAPKGPRFVEILEIMDRPDIPFATIMAKQACTFKSNLIHTYTRQHLHKHPPKYPR